MRQPRHEWLRPVEELSTPSSFPQDVAKADREIFSPKKKASCLYWFVPAAITQQPRPTDLKT